MNPGAPDDPDATAVVPRVTDDTVVINMSAAETAVIDRQVAKAEPPEATTTRLRMVRRHRAGGRDVRRMIRTGGELMITIGAILLLFTAYEIWGKAALVASAQDDLNTQLEQQWSDPVIAPSTPAPSVGPTAQVPPVPSGDAIARLYLPRLGKSWVVVEGITPADIKYTPGHYPGTAMPGQLGNFAVAGHRIAAIFWDLDQLRPGDPVVVETRDTWYVYHVTQQLVVVPTAVEVVAPVPEHPGQTPSVPMMTMTTCNPKFNNYQRLVVHAVWDHSMDHAAGRPAELG
jgi:sortase A